MDLGDVMCPNSFVYFWHYINCLFAYLASLITFFLLIYFLIHLLPYLSVPSRIGLFYFQARGHRRRPNLVLVFWVYYVLLYIWLWIHMCFCCVIYIYSISVLSQKSDWENVSKMIYFELPILCWVGPCVARGNPPLSLHFPTFYSCVVCVSESVQCVSWWIFITYYII